MTAKSSDAARLVRLLLKHHKQKEIAARLHVSQGTISKWLAGTHDPGSVQYKDLMAMAMRFEGEPEDGPRAISRVDGKRINKSIAGDAIPELAGYGGGGGGGYPVPTEIVDGERSYGADVVSDEWVMPRRFLRDELRVALPNLDILRIRGDSMETGEYGGFREGDRVVVNRADRAIRQGGIFAIRDHDETIIKQVEIVRGSDPVRIVCTSLNKNYSPFELILDDTADVIGRIVLKISRT